MPSWPGVASTTWTSPPPLRRTNCPAGSRRRWDWRSRSGRERRGLEPLDEPLASLDPLARREFLHVLVDAARADGITALLSSHVITDIEQACYDLLVLGGGRVLLDLSIEGAIAEHRVIGTGQATDFGHRRRHVPLGPTGNAST